MRNDTSTAVCHRDLVAFVANAAIHQASLCLSGDAALAPQHFSQEVKFPDETTVDCTPTRECSSDRSCSFEPQRDTRNCKACLLRRPWDGGCVQEGNDPFCEAQKAAQNVIYDADAAAKKADCERLKAQEKLQCEAEKTGQKALCETGKELLKRLARTGKFANLDGDVAGRTKGLRVCLKDFAVSPNLARIQLTLEVSGGAEADVSLKFVPLDIVGHLACQFPWTDSKTFQATLRDSTVSLASDLRVATNGGKPSLVFATQEVTVPLRLQPGPTEYLLTSANLTLACQGLNLLKPLIVSLTPFIPELRGDIDYKQKSQEVKVEVELPSQTVGNRVLAGKLNANEHALWVEGSLQAPATPGS